MHRASIFFVLATAAFCATPSPEALKGVTAAEKAWTEAAIKRDRSALDKLMADDLSYTHSSAKTQTKKEFLDDATGGGTTYKSIEFSDTHMRQYGTTVVVTHNAVITSVPTGTSHLYITEVWAKTSGGWQMVSRQATKPPQ